MDISLLRNRSINFKNLFTSLKEFKFNNPNSTSNSEALTLIKGSILLGLALIFAWIGKTQTELSAQEQTLQNQWPTPAAFNAVMKNGGWSELKNPDLSNLLKNHPDPFTSKPILWASDDHCLIFLTHSPYTTTAPAPPVWSCATSQKLEKRKIKWIKIGSGYKGVDQLSKIMFEPLKKPRSYIDPKEIRY